jgi:magnesium transporter
MPLNKSQVDTLRRLVRHGNTPSAARALAKFSTPDIALLFSDLDAVEGAKFLTLLIGQRRGAEVVTRLPSTIVQELLSHISDLGLRDLLTHAPVDDAVEMLKYLSDERRSAILPALSDSTRARLENLLAYPEGSAGAIMTTEFLAIMQDQLVDDAIRIVRERPDLEAGFYVYVVDAQQRLVGVMSLRQLVLARPTQALATLMTTEVISISPLAFQEEAAQLTAAHDFLALPVVDEAQHLLGIITVDDVVDVLTEEATQDMYRLQGLSDADRVFSPIHTSARMRLPWMVINLATAFLAALIVGLFENTIAQLVTLATFMPVVAGMGGNGGTQSLTVVTRAIALGEIEFSSAWRAIAKECAVGVIVGAATGLITAVVAYLWKGNVWLGLILFLAMMINLAIAGFSGAAVPLFLRAIKQDPAIGGSIILTTFTDVFGFLAFLGLATLFIHWLL